MNGGVRVDPVRSARDLRTFIHFPWQIYRGDRLWVPPLISDQKKLLARDRHPFHQHAEVEYFLARSDGRVRGRIAAFVNENHNAFHEERVGFFGFFECEDAAEVAEALFDQAAAWLRARGMETMRGPASFSSNEEWAMLVEGFDLPPALMMAYNPPYYAQLVEGAGFAKAKDLLAWTVSPDSLNERFQQVRRIGERARSRGNVSVRTADMKRFAAELETIKEVYNHAWERNWGFVPMTDAEISHMAKELKPVVVPRLVLLAEVEGKPAGFVLMLPDYNEALRHANGRLFPLGLIKLLWYARRVKRVRVLTFGVVHAFQKRGIDALLIAEGLQNAFALGYTNAEASWTLEDNQEINNMIGHFGFKPYKRYRVYDRALA